MSLSGSVVQYDNNNEEKLNTSTSMSGSGSMKSSNHVNSHKHPLVAAVSTQTSTGTSSKKKTSCWHLNSLWSIWYGLLATAAQTYILLLCARRVLGYSTLAWVGDVPKELLASGALLGAAAILLPLFLAATLLKAGNLPNDGFKLGSKLSTCSFGPQSSLMPSQGSKNTGVLRSLWQHGGPTGPFLHLVIAFCLLLPRLLMEAKLIETGFLPQDNMWRTDLDFLLVNKDRYTVLSYMNPPENSSSMPTPLPFVTSPPTTAIFDDDDEEDEDISTLPTTIFTTLPSTVTNLPQTMRPAYQTLKPAYQTLKPPSKRQQYQRRRITTTPRTFNENRKSGKNQPREQLPKSLPFSMEKTLRKFIGSEPIDLSESTNGWGGPVSLEYLNYAIALLVYAVRYPAVFWNTNKGFGLIFSLQLLVNGVHNMISFAGMSVLYKVQMAGGEKVLPLLKHEILSEVNLLGGQTPFLLNPHVTLALFIMSGLLILASSLVLYLYGYGRFNAFLNREREKRIIIVKETGIANGWGYFTHCAALCVLLAIAVCSAPLLHDYTIVYRGSLDNAVLVCIISTVLHLFLWILVWLFLTIKQKWIFKIRVTIGRATIRSARSIKLVTDIDLLSSKDEDLTSQPLLVVGNGRTYSVSELSPKRAIMTVIQKAAMDKKAKGTGEDDDGEEQIYWLRPKTMSLNASDSDDKLNWFNKKLANNNTNGKSGQKVTFNDVPCTSNSRNKERGTSLRVGETDDGDYATLRELPLGSAAALMDPGDDTSEEGKLLACVRDDSVTYACTNRDLVPPSCEFDNEDTCSPPATPDVLPDPPTEPSSQMSPVTTSSAVTVHTSECQSNSGLTPRCLRRADSGVPGDDTHRSGSGSSGSSPPDPPGSTNSDSSSGIHSAASLSNHRPRANSLDDFILDVHQPSRDENKIKSFSLQRGMLPPNFNLMNNTVDATQPVYGFSGIHYTTMHHPISNGHCISENGVPATIVENSSESTVIIRRKSLQPKVKTIIPQPVINEEPFGRSMNMKMTTFTTNRENNIVSSSATLPHYPTQPVDVAPPLCSTMPTSIEARGIMMPPPMVSGSSCQSFSRPHCTLPNHQGGLRLVSAVPAIRRPQFNNNNNNRPRIMTAHHSFPVHLIQNTNYSTQTHLSHDIERDSANFSMASSGDSDTSMYISMNRA